ncbi:receptor-type tyrosine-protein phosphatase epsilon-like [Ciona intestinalis]
MTEKTDYINASYIDGYSQRCKFIATQGPLDRTVEDFWRMVWEQECLIIVMLTNTVESGKEKCAKYWPDHGKHFTYGDYRVETLSEINYEPFILRAMNIQENNNEYEMVLRKIHHFQYTEWQDENVPLIASPLIEMKIKVNAVWLNLSEGKQFPIVVHGSAGVGRTGVYIGFDILLDEMKSKNQVNVFRTVLNMRKQRIDMVQNMKQYVFLHKLLSQYYAAENIGLEKKDGKVFEEI